MELLTLAGFILFVFISGYLIWVTVTFAWKAYMYLVTLGTKQPSNGPQTTFTPPSQHLPVPEPSDGEAAEPAEIANSTTYQAWLTQAIKDNQWRPTHSPRHTK